MSGSNWWEIFPMVGLVLIVLQTAACALLLGERGPGVWLMLTGSVLELGTYLFFKLVSFLPSLLMSADLPEAVAFLPGTLGVAIFVAGLSMVALRRRATWRRVAELELIIAELQARAAR